jgi:integrase
MVSPCGDSMTMTAQDDLAGILEKCNDPAARLLLAGSPAIILPEQVSSIEQFLIQNSPAGKSIDTLLGEFYAKLGDVCPDVEKKHVPKTIVRYPTAPNPFARGVTTVDGRYREGARWFQERLPDWNQASPDDPAACLKMFLISAVLQFEILHVDSIAALILSLQRKCTQSDPVLALHRTLIAVPLAYHAGSSEHGEERLFVAGGTSNDLLRAFLRHPDCAALLVSLAGAAAQPTADAMLVELEDAVPEGYRFPVSIDLPNLIKAARGVAILHVPPAVVAHRGREYRSHGLRLDVLKRIGAYNLAPLERVSAGRRSEKPFDADPSRPGPAPPWMTALRAAVQRNKIDRRALDRMADGSDPVERCMGEYAKSLRSKPSSLHKTVFLIANRLMPRFETSDPADVEEDTWEEVIEQVLDEDEFFRRPDVAESETRRRRGHSQALLSSLHSFIRFLERRKEKFRELHEKVPAAGPMRVDANLVTVDEYKAALRWLGCVDVYPDAEMIEASRVALILGYRCGLRRAESGFLRLGDFDDADYLHLRPSKMRKLKTSNARRDVPLGVLIPDNELKVLKQRIAKIRARAEAALEAKGTTGSPSGKEKSDERTWRDALLFPTVKDPFSAGDFEQIVERVQESIKVPKRGFSGDNDFHYHVLRHSFANIMLLKLWPTLHPMARRILHRHPQTLSWISGCEKFRRDLFGTDAIRGSDLQAIALLMGHGSSATTLEHYLHVMDWYRPGGSEAISRDIADEEADDGHASLADMPQNVEAGKTEEHMQ